MQSKNSFNCALITGATSGLGEAFAHLLAEKKIELILTGRSSSILPIDLSKKESRQKLLALISAKQPDLIINNAGFGFYGNTLDLPIEQQLEMLEVNINALVEISIHAANELIRVGKRGTILNISSAAAFFPFPGFNVYSASKRFVNQFSLALDAELREQGVRVLCACPGQIDTNFRSRAAMGHPQKTDRRTMSAESAAQHLWKQIQKEKRLYIFDWRTRMMVWSTKLIPNFLLEKILSKEISSRTGASSSLDI